MPRRASDAFGPSVHATIQNFDEENKNTVVAALVHRLDRDGSCGKIH